MLVIKKNKLKVLHRYEPIVILGQGSFARDLEEILINHGFYVKDLITSKDLAPYPNKKAQLLIGIFNRETPFSKLVKEAELAGFETIFLPWEYYERFQTDLGWRYWLTYPEYIFENITKINDVETLLSDEHSKQLLTNIVQFRTGQNIDYSQYQDSEPQYFNYLTLANTVKCYIDGGAYTGDSYWDLCKLTKVDQTFLFEPDPENFKKLSKTIHDAVCLPLALADQISLVSFNFNKGESGAITTLGLPNVLAVSIDDLFRHKQVDLIKLDLEGGEIAALNGAKEVLANSRPRLAVSLYHKPDDLWNIPLLLKSLCPDYKFYIRQHYYNSFDCVLYGIPE